jgi:hypothetical protein
VPQQATSAAAVVPNTVKEMTTAMYMHACSYDDCTGRFNRPPLLLLLLCSYPASTTREPSASRAAPFGILF